MKLNPVTFVGVRQILRSSRSFLGRCHGLGMKSLPQKAEIWELGSQLAVLFIKGPEGGAQLEGEGH